MRYAVTLLLFAVLVTLEAPTPAAQQKKPDFIVGVDLVTTDVIVRDQRNQFVADLKPGEIEVFEDGVKQNIASILLIHGGRQFNVQSLPSPVQEGVIVPRNRPTSDAAGRIFLIVIDDFHLDPTLTPKVRQLMGQVLRTVIHDGDMFGIVSTGYSSISEQLTYDRQVLESAISRITAGGLTPKEVIQGAQGSQGPTELRHRAHVAFSTAYDLMRNLEKVQNRRKAVLYISSGYDFNPFAESRVEEQALRMHVEAADLQNDPFFRTQQSSQLLNAADLVRELAELTRAANRANATIYTIDPRGLSAGPDIDQDLKTVEWNAHLRESQDSLRVLSEETGGFAIVNTNGFEAGLKRIDNETSDYYVLGYYSSNQDPLKRVRRIEVKTTRAGAVVFHRTAYTRAPAR
ncbi:MAG TPA: VWA domain-containing protein [Vicinamibacterales bacterium]|nr:VWA domain-containing protein [Vicinamibacterales bacterium]